MLDSAEQQRIVQEVFAATGRTLPLDDPIVLAALFNASVVRSAGENAAAAVAKAAHDIIHDLTRAAELNRAETQGGVDAATAVVSKVVDEAMRNVRAAVDEAQTAARSAGKAADTASTVALSVSRQSAVHQATFIDILDRRLPWSAGNSASDLFSPVSQVLRPRRHDAVAGAIAGAVIATMLNFAACGYSFSWVHDASIGRQFLGALPYLDHELKARLLSDLEKLQPRT